MPDQTLLDHGRLDDLLARARRDVDDGPLPSGQLALALDGEVVAAHTLGKASDTSRYTVFSVTKALVAAGTWLLIGEGTLSADTRVAELVPEFGSNGKDVVTLEHLLTHTAGFPRAPMRPEDGATSEGRRTRFASWRLDWDPGTQLEYHASSAHWVVVELIEVVTGQDFRTFLLERVLQPLGLRHLRLGVPVGEGGDILDVETVGSGDNDYRIAEINTTTLHRYNEPAVRAVGVPGAGAVSTAADVAMLYQALLRNDPPLWDPQVLADGTGRVRTTYVDPLRGCPANRTLGLVVAGDDGHAVLREFGKATGPRAFGASGVGGQVAWADPDTGLSFCWLTNGLDADIVATFKRSTSLSTYAAQCVAAKEAPA